MNSQTPNHQSDGDSEQVHQPRPQAGPDELLSSYLDGELSADEIAAVEAHPGDGQKAVDEMCAAGADLSRSDAVWWEPTSP